MGRRHRAATCSRPLKTHLMMSGLEPSVCHYFDPGQALRQALASRL
jgi:hypothetical protein